MSANSQRLECPTCKKMFSRDMIKRHMYTKHSGIKKLTCSSCTSWFTTEDDLKLHSQTCKRKKRENVICSICGEIVKSCNFRLHTLNKHTEKKEEICTVCGKILTSKGSLKKHMETHQDKKPCPECGLLVRKMKEHMDTVHSPEHLKKYQCQECGKGFREKAILNNHNMNVHLRTRPYNSRYGCEMSYNDVSNRNAHEKKKHGSLYSKAKVDS